MKLKKYEECSFELTNIENTMLIESNNNEEQIRQSVIDHLIKLDSCNDDFKELLKNNLAKIEVKKYYVPVYSIKAMVNDDYRISYLEDGNATIHVVCGENETRLDEENVEKVHKEEVVRFEADYHFCCSEYKGEFSNNFINLEFNKYITKNDGFENISIVDNFIPKKTLEKLINEKVKQAFFGQGTNQSKKYILKNHEEAEYLDCKQNTKVVDCQKTLYLVPLFEIICNFNDEEYVSYISGIENYVEYDFPRSKDFTVFNAASRKNYFLKYVSTIIMVLLLCGVGIVGALFLNEKVAKFTNTYLIITSIFIAIVGIISLIIYLINHKKYKKIKEVVLNKYEKATNKPKSLYLKSLIAVNSINLVCIIGIILLLII